MSHTNTAARKLQNPTEFYPTPAKCTEALLRGCAGLWPGARRPRWLEPCAGAGAIVRAVIDYGNSRWSHDLLPQWDLNEYDIRHRDALSWLKLLLKDLDCLGSLRFTDAREYRTETPYDVAITNPPFSLAAEIYAVCRPLATYTVLLLPVGFLGAAKRYPWLSKDMPDVGILTPRPQFTNQGSDSATYAWMIWGPERRTEGRVFLLPTDEQMTSTAQENLL